MIEIKKTTKKTKSINWMNIRLCIVTIIAILCFIIVIGHLAIIQFVQGKELSERAYNQQIENKILSPNRGTIYDAKGEILAQSIKVDTISVNPGKIKNAQNKVVSDEVVAKGLSEIFNVTYEKLLEDLKSNKSVIVIERKVEKDKVDKLKNWMTEQKITAGINIDDDAKRYYPYDTLASNLIGFCGTDNIGQTGLEQRWNSVLTGTIGKIVTVTDVHDQAISDENEQYIATENGSNIYLTIDASIQAIAEKYLDQAMVENPTATGGNVIIMNPQTGDILAMASNPYYNLNEPSSYINLGYTEEEWNAIEKTERSNILQDVWKNRAVSGTYEPGSTFKLLIASIGLEEGIVQTDTENDFMCTGPYLVAEENGEPQYISCWRKVPHGPNSLRGALEGSCNPAFMQLGKRIGPQILYKYFDAFGLFEPVGNDIARAYKGTFTDLDSVGPVELATTSFGQRFEISPLQLITAVSAICNDGVLVKPKIVKQIENTDTKSIEVIETEKEEGKENLQSGEITKENQDENQLKETLPKETLPEEKNKKIQSNRKDIILAPGSNQNSVIMQEDGSNVIIVHGSNKIPENYTNSTNVNNGFYMNITNPDGSGMNMGTYFNSNSGSNSPRKRSRAQIIVDKE